jgi:hypothetical protein
MPLDDTMVIEVIGVGPRVEQEVWIAWPYRTLGVGVEIVLVFETAHDLADIAVVQAGLTDELDLGLELLRMEQELTGDPRTLGRKHVRGPAPFDVLVRLALDPDAQSRCDNLGVPGQIELGNARLLAKLPADWAHEGDDDERQSRVWTGLGGALETVDRRSYRAGRRAAPVRRHEPMPGKRDRVIVGPGATDVLHLDFGWRGGKQVGQRFDEFGDGLLFVGRLHSLLK